MPRGGGSCRQEKNAQKEKIVLTDVYWPPPNESVQSLRKFEQTLLLDCSLIPVFDLYKCSHTCIIL